MCSYFLIVMRLEFSKTEWEETFQNENHLAGCQSHAQGPTDFPDPTFGVQRAAGNRYRSGNRKLPQGLRQSLKAQTHVAKALWDLLLQGVKARTNAFSSESFKQAPYPASSLAPTGSVAAH